MTLLLTALVTALGLLLGMLLMQALGRRIGLARRRRGIDDDARAAAAVEAAVFGLLGLLLAFTFSGAMGRFEARRHLITSEANSIGTAYLRLDLLPADQQPGLRQLFRDYLEIRARSHRDEDVPVATAAVEADTARLQRRIWTAATAASAPADVAASTRQLLLPALNEMFDITTTRAVAAQNHPPLIILALLIGLCLLGGLLVGHSAAGGKGRSWFHSAIFAATMALTLYVVIDLEYPRAGLIRIDTADQTIADLRSLMR